MECWTLRTFPDSAANLKQLERLVAHLSSSALPAAIPQLQALRILNLKWGGLSLLPLSFGSSQQPARGPHPTCPCLRPCPPRSGSSRPSSRMNLGCDSLVELPESLRGSSRPDGKLSSKGVAKGASRLVTLSASLRGLIRVSKHLELKYCNDLSALPSSFGALRALEFLRLVLFF